MRIRGTRAALQSVVILTVAVVAWPVQAGDRRVIDPVPEGADFVQSIADYDITEHVIAAINEPFPQVVSGSKIDAETLDWNKIVDIKKLDIRRPVRFTFDADDVGTFTVPAVMRVYIAARTKHFNGERFLPDDKSNLQVRNIVLTKAPVYTDPKVAYTEIEGWNEALRELGYKRLNFDGLESRSEFLDHAHADMGDHVGSNFPAFYVAAWTHGHTGILLTIQRSPHPDKEGPKAHGFNVGIGIFDRRVAEFYFDGVRTDDD